MIFSGTRSRAVVSPPSPGAEETPVEKPTMATDAAARAALLAKRREARVLKQAVVEQQRQQEENKAEQLLKKEHWGGNGSIRIFPNVFSEKFPSVSWYSHGRGVTIHTQCLDECGDFGKIWEVVGKHLGGVLSTCLDPRSRS